jgi:hypothetical protein
MLHKRLIDNEDNNSELGIDLCMMIGTISAKLDVGWDD